MDRERIYNCRFLKQYSKKREARGPQSGLAGTNNKVFWPCGFSQAGTEGGGSRNPKDMDLS
jgi:hypothetical protein